MTVFLDANVFLYAAGGESPQKAACVEILRRATAGRIEATTNAEVLQELLHVLSRRGLRDRGLELAAEVSALFPTLLPVTRDDVAHSLELLRKHPNLNVRDAIHAATMRTHSIGIIVSTDTGFDHIPGIRRKSPAEACDE